MLHVLSFGSYDPKQERIDREDPSSDQRFTSNFYWLNLQRAVFNPPIDSSGAPMVQLGNSPARTAAAVELVEAFKESEHPKGGNVVNLTPEGFEMALGDAAWELLKELWEVARSQQPPSLVLVVKRIDDFLQSAKEYSVDEWTKHMSWPEAVPSDDSIQ